MDKEERRDLVILFLRRCVKYADESIRRKKQRGESEDVISKWSDYRDFTAHAVEEVTSGDLDSWLEDGPVSYDPEN